MRRRKQVGDAVLRVVGVLVLVHADVAEPSLVRRRHRGVLGEQAVGVDEQVVEVHRVGGQQPRLVAGIDLARLLVHRRYRLGRELSRCHQLVLRCRDAMDDSVERIHLVVDVQLSHDVLEHALGVVGVIDREVAREAEHLAVGAQHAHTHRVEREHPHAVRAVAVLREQLVQTLAHLGRGLVGERDREDLVRAHALVADEVRDAVREHARLARAGACQDQKRAFGGKRSFALRGVE